MPHTRKYVAHVKHRSGQVGWILGEFGRSRKVVGQWIVGVKNCQKIFGLCGLKVHTVEKK